MEVEIKKSGDEYRVELWDLPGTYPVGFGKTKIEAVFNLFQKLIFEHKSDWVKYIDLTTLNIEDSTLDEDKELHRWTI